MISEGVKLIFDLISAAITARAEHRAEIIAQLTVALEALDKANDAEDAAHAARTAETRRIIEESETVLIDPKSIIPGGG